MKQTISGLLIGLLLSSVRCMGVEPAHAMDDDQAMLEVARAINRQTQVLERIAVEMERCK